MKENRLGPRQWAFVIVAGGAAMALPFTQREPDAKPKPPVVDVEATLLPEANIAASNNPAAATGQTSTGLDEALSTPTWPTLPHSPFDDLVQQKAIVPEAKPTEDIVPMQPLRPWISAPGLRGGLSGGVPDATVSNNSLASSPTPNSGSSRTISAMTNSPNAVAMASPWRDDGAASVDDSSQVAQAIGQANRQLPVDAGPADRYTSEEIAQKLKLPTQELASAIVPAEHVLPIPNLHVAPPGVLATQSLPAHHQPTLAAEPRSTAINTPKSSVVLGRQSAPRAPGTAIRFGQANDVPNATATSPTTMSPPAMSPLPSLPPERRGHIIMQPIRP